MAFIEVLGLGHRLPGKRLLFRQVEFKVASGQRGALVGANGVGKSTLLRIVAGEDNECVGTARVDASAEALERALGLYPGTVIAVTHDRWFLRGFDRFFEFGKNGTVAELQHAA